MLFLSAALAVLCWSRARGVPLDVDAPPAHFARCDSFGRRFLYSQTILWPTSLGADMFVMLVEDVDVNQLYSREQWKRSFTEPPRYDRDHWSWNYGAHPVMGAFSYLAYRNRGGHWAEGVLGAALNSVIYEYVIAGAMQQPSVNDMIATPLLGGLLGEGVYLLKKRLVRDRRLGAWERVLVTVTDPFEVLHYGFNYGHMARAAYR